MKTLKALVAKYNAASLILRILVGLLVGVVLRRPVIMLMKPVPSASTPR